MQKLLEKGKEFFVQEVITKFKRREVNMEEKKDVRYSLIFNREGFVMFLFHRGCRVGAEIGVREGAFSELLFKNIPDLHLYCIDPWVPYVECPSTRRQNRYFEETKQRLSPYNATFLRMTSMEALDKIPDDSLDFVYIDGAHDFESVSADLSGWYNKVKTGGIMSGHDYHTVGKYTAGVIPAVDAHVKGKGVPLWITNERLSSWFYIK